MLTEIYLCHACSFHDIEGANDRDAQRVERLGRLRLHPRLRRAAAGARPTRRAVHPPDTPRRPAPLAFRSLMRPILAEIYLCHACSCQEIEDDEARRPMLAEIYLCHAWSGHETDCGYAVGPG
jgi:hypothetical protein